jgi:hypothetical protein
MSGHSLLACLSLNTRLWVKLRSPSHVEIINTSGAGNGMTPVMRHLGHTSGLREGHLPDDL